MKSPQRREHDTCCIVTVPANDTVASIHHDRTPVILLGREAIEFRLDLDVCDVAGVPTLLEPAPADLPAHHHVDHRLLSRRDKHGRRYSGPECIEPLNGTAAQSQSQDGL